MAQDTTTEKQPQEARPPAQPEAKRRRPPLRVSSDCCSPAPDKS